jgi:hypothetical protein
MPVTPVVPTPPADPSNLSSGDYTSTVILNRIFSLILNMISSLQNAAAAQANRLTFMSSWQSAYTDAMSQIHTFVRDDGHAFAEKFSSSAVHRDDMNRLNASFTQTLQNRQSVVSDSAKSLQSNVNQSNDAVNQQSNLGTAIIQELSTLLGTIFH